MTTMPRAVYVLLPLSRPSASGNMPNTMAKVVMIMGRNRSAAAFARRRAVASGASGVAALAAYLLDYLGRVWDPARAVSGLSPFHYFEPMSLISGAGLSGRNVVVLLAAGLVGTAASFIVFARRDL